MMKKRFLLTTWEGGGVVPPELGMDTRLETTISRANIYPPSFATDASPLK